MFLPSSSNSFIYQIGKIPQTLRWQVCYRLQELRIPCWCPTDGSLWVEVHDCVAAVLVRSTVQQYLTPRQELVDWLERCWQA